MAVEAAHADWAEHPRRDVDLIAAEVEKGQQLAGHFPSREAMERGRKVFTGAMTAEEAYAELEKKYSSAK
ncbi:MAG TPA: hypothetical protein VJQ61_06125 [Sinomonas sp.]|nr:hypothetical protein [Sinomonas sp.]